MLPGRGRSLLRSRWVGRKVSTVDERTILGLDPTPFSRASFHSPSVVWFFPPICGSVQGALLGRNKEAGEAAGRQPTHPIELFPETYHVLQLARLELTSSNVGKGTVVTVSWAEVKGLAEVSQIWMLKWKCYLPASWCL